MSGTWPSSRSPEWHHGTQRVHRRSLPAHVTTPGTGQDGTLPGPAPGQGAGVEEWVGERQKEGERG